MNIVRGGQYSLVNIVQGGGGGTVFTSKYCPRGGDSIH